jgi:uncharacterized protein YpmB
MAEIKIRKKRPIWPWILLVVVILVVLAYLYLESTDPVPHDEETETKAVGANVFIPQKIYGTGHNTAMYSTIYQRISEDRILEVTGIGEVLG